MDNLVYHRAETLDEVLTLLDQHGDDAKVLAGGQSLIPMMSAGLAAPRILIDINRVSGLDRVLVENREVAVGALVRHRALEDANAEVARAIPLFPVAAPLIAHAPIRNRGTFVGSLVHADPSAEWPAVTLATGAQIRLARRGGERTISAEDFFLGPLTANIEPEELAVEVRLGTAPARTGVSVQELAYRAGDYAIVGVAAQISVDDAGEIADVRLALFGVDATPLRVTEAEAVLRDVGAAGIDEAAHIAREAVAPSSDATASADYRRDMINVYCRRALAEALMRSGVPHH